VESTSAALPIGILPAANQLIPTILMKLVVVFIPMAMEPHTSNAIPVLDNTLCCGELESNTDEYGYCDLDFGPFTFRIGGF
jgi:hypothetical protein